MLTCPTIQSKYTSPELQLDGRSIKRQIPASNPIEEVIGIKRLAIESRSRQERNAGRSPLSHRFCRYWFAIFGVNYLAKDAG